MLQNQAYYRIHTEDKNLETILDETSNLFASFSVYNVIGFWKAEQEGSLVLEFLMEDSWHNDGLVYALAGSIKHLNKQEKILVTKTPCTCTYI